VSWLYGLAITGAVLAVILFVDLLARSRHRRALAEARRTRDRIRRREQLEHARRVERLKIVGGARPDVSQRDGGRSDAGGDSAASGLREDVPEASPRPDEVEQ
jgi:hypothetical protein